MAEELIGYYSDLKQPIVPLTLGRDSNSTQDPTPFLLDTGVNVDLLVPVELANILNWPVSAVVEEVEMADGSFSNAVFAYPYIYWQGSLQQCTALALLPDPEKKEKRRSNPRQAYDGFVGMGLLRGTVIEFASNIVRITKGAI